MIHLIRHRETSLHQNTGPLYDEYHVYNEGGI